MGEKSCLLANFGGFRFGRWRSLGCLITTRYPGAEVMWVLLARPGNFPRGLGGRAGVPNCGIILDGGAGGGLPVGDDVAGQEALVVVGKSEAGRLRFTSGRCAFRPRSGNADPQRQRPSGPP